MYACQSCSCSAERGKCIFPCEFSLTRRAILSALDMQNIVKAITTPRDGSLAMGTSYPYPSHYYIHLCLESCSNQSFTFTLSPASKSRETHEAPDLPICSPWTFRENHSPNIIYTVNRRNQPTAMNLYFLDWVRTRYKTEPETHTKSAHTDGTMTKRTPAMNWDHAVSWGGGLG